MAGINRLGKAAPRPGSLRPVDPTRNRITDHFSENSESLESDRDYQRAVQDIEDAQQTQGWLFSRGAFDKTDLLYLRDQEEKSRHTEMELHDKEVSAYARMRMQSEKQKPPGAGVTTSALGVTKTIEKERLRPQPKGLQRIVKVNRAAGAAAAQPAAAQSSGSSRTQQPDAAGSAGLGDLLGAYGSGSDSEDEHSGDKAAPAASPAAPEGVTSAGVQQSAAAASVQPLAAAAGGVRQRSRSHSPAEEELDYGDGLT